jgi:hypothetical protein
VEEIFFFSKSAQAGSRAHSIPSVLGFCPRGNRPGCEVNHSLLSSVEFTNEWRYTAAPPTYLNGLDREKLTFVLSTINLKKLK